jgi:hypothetical protein
MYVLCLNLLLLRQIISHLELPANENKNGMEFANMQKVLPKIGREPSGRKRQGKIGKGENSLTTVLFWTENSLL